MQSVGERVMQKGINAGRAHPVAQMARDALLVKPCPAVILVLLKVRHLQAEDS